MNGRRRTASLHIERVVLEGLPLTAGQGVRLRASLERELARLIEARGDGQGGRARAGRAADAPRPGGSPDRSPPVVWEPTRPRQLGRALARTVFASLDLPASGAPRPRGRS
jgi:hypothetical protein